MKKSKFTASKKRIILIVSAIVVLIAIVASGTFAWYTDMVASKTNTFTAGTVSCEVLEETFDGVVKKNVSVKNTGNIDAYVRAALVINWVDDEGNVYATAPVADEDYALDVNTANWLKADDGYYYCKTKVAPENNSAILINSCKPIEGSIAPEGCHLQVNVLASAIQANPADAVSEAWTSVTVSDGQLTANVAVP